MNNTQISVVIVAYKRDNFLAQSINSVLNQTLEKSFYEIVVITDFEFAQKNEFEKLGVRFFLDKQKEYCKKISSIVEHLNGNIVCFLDDDDLFHEKKLSHVLEIFSTNYDLFFTQNNMRIINEAGNTEKDKFYNLKYTLNDNILEINSYEDIRNIFKMNIGFNNSSISVRKEVLTKNLDILIQMDGRMDAFLLLSSLSTNKKICFINDVLTDYRVHDSNNSIALFNVKKRTEMYRRHHSDWVILAEFSKNSENEWIKEIIDEQLVYFSIMIKLFSSNIKKNEILNSLSVFMKKYNLSIMLKNSIIFVALISLFSKTSARWLIGSLSMLMWKIL